MILYLPIYLLGLVLFLLLIAALSTMFCISYFIREEVNMEEIK